MNPSNDNLQNINKNTSVYISTLVQVILHIKTKIDMPYAN